MFCPNCGTKLEDDAVFCSSCGVRIAKDEPVTPNEEAPVYPQEEPESQEANQDVWQQPVPVQMPPVDQSQQTPPVEMPKDYLVVNIILTVISFFACCGCTGFIGLITGIIGIVFSSQVKKAVQAGDYATAAEKSKTAKIMWIVTAVLVALGIIMSIIFFVTGLLGEVMSELY